MTWIISIITEREGSRWGGGGGGGGLFLKKNQKDI